MTSQSVTGVACRKDIQWRRNMLLLSGLPFPSSYRGQETPTLLVGIICSRFLTTRFPLFSYYSQPTLHKPGIMAHYVRVLYSRTQNTLRMHYASEFYFCFVCAQNCTEFYMYTRFVDRTL
jgi:hypothetical protein